MTTVQKFYDELWKETTPELADKCVRMTMDDTGNVIESATFLAQPRTSYSTAPVKAIEADILNIADLIEADDNCGTGAGGFQPGNTCGKGGGSGGEPKVYSDKKSAVDAIVESAVSERFQSERSKEMGRTMAEITPEQIRKNWTNHLSARSKWKYYPNGEGLMPFDNLDKGLVSAVNKANKEMYENSNFKEWSDQFGVAPVIVRNLEKGTSHQAEWIGSATHYYPNSFSEWKTASPSLKLGGYSVGGDDIATVLRHEYGHGVSNTMNLDGIRNWDSFYHANRDKFTNEISKYAGTKPNEGFSEVFAAITHKDYKRSDHEGKFITLAEDELRKSMKL